MTREGYTYGIDSPLNATDPTGLLAVALCRSGKVSYSALIGGRAGLEQCLGGLLGYARRN